MTDVSGEGGGTGGPPMSSLAIGRPRPFRADLLAGPFPEGHGQT
jgi:hypothetical protein